MSRFDDREPHRFTDVAANVRSSQRKPSPVRLDEESLDEIRSNQAQQQADEIALIRAYLARSGDGHVGRAANVVLENGLTNRMPKEQYKAFNTATHTAVRQALLDGHLADLERRYRAEVVHEPGPYEAGSPHSWVADNLAAADGDGSLADRAASGYQERLNRHDQDLARAMRERNAYGKVAERAFLENYRQPDVHLNQETATKRLQEFRALSSGGGTTVSASGAGAASFVPPIILLEAWSHYRSPFAAFVSQLNDSVALPDYGMVAYLPAWTSGTTVATFTEGSGVSELDPVSGFVSGQIVEKAGMVTASQAFLDRAGPGISGDVILFQQLKDQLSAQVDAYALAQALTNAQTVTNSGSFALAGTTGVGGFMGDLKKAKGKLTDTAGVRLRGTHAFGTGDFIDYISSYSDGQGRPAFSPSFDDMRLPIKSAGDGQAEGYSGYVLAGLALFADDSVPLSGSDTQVIVCRPSTILQLSGEVVTSVYPQGAASNLESQVIVRQYVATIPRYPTGVASISGAAYTASTFA